jgi:hypothetical protein
MRGSSVFVMICAAVVIAGCCAKSGSNECATSKVIAKINDYELTADDFIGEVKLVSPNINLSSNIEKAKEDALDELITKKVLLQEAQRQNFDKDNRFMKEIERYWEQALLKLLMRKKIDEFSKKISPDIKGDLKHRMIQAQLDEWINDLRKSAKIATYKDNLKRVEVK